MNIPKNGLTLDDWLMACTLVAETINAAELCAEVVEEDPETGELGHIILYSRRARVAVYLTLVIEDDGDEYHTPVYAVSIDDAWEMSIGEASDYIKAARSEAQTMLIRLASAISTVGTIWPEKLYGL